MEKKIVKELVLALLYMTSWKEEAFDGVYYRSWKGYPFEILDELTEENLIFNKHRSKSVSLSDKGVKQAITIINNYNLGTFKINDKD